MDNQLTAQFDHAPQLFHGIRFLLLGFDPINKSEVLRKLVSGGGVDAGQYGPNCTHVIVHKIVYDDPICVAARRDGKILVTDIWVDHSFDVGVTVDASSVMYKPLRDLNGIPGAKSFVICLTGYQRDDREDIMTMVDLMGARFSKPLIANKVTHLICYKFEGEKYLLAKRMKRIKLINHRWLEDCLKAWEIISESNYSKSGYELELEEAEAKDSEDEAEVAAARHNDSKVASPRHSLMLKQDVSSSLPNTCTSKGFHNAEDTVPVTTKHTSDQFPNPHKNVTGLTCEPSNLFEATVDGSATRTNIIAFSKVANKSPSNEARKGTSTSYTRNVSRTTPPTVEMAINNSGAGRLGMVSLGDNTSLVEKVNDGSKNAPAGLRTPCNTPAFSLEEEHDVSFSGKRKMDISGGSSKLQRLSHAMDISNQESLHVEGAFQELKEYPPEEMSNRLSPGTAIHCLNNINSVSPASNNSRRKSLSSKGKSIACDVLNLKTSATEIVQDKDLEAVCRPMNKYRESNLVKTSDSKDVGMALPERAITGSQKLGNGIQSLDNSLPFDVEKSTSLNLEINERSIGSNSKVGKKFLAPKHKLSKLKTLNQKESIYLENSEPRNDAMTSMIDVEGLAENEISFNHQKFPMAKSGVEIEMEVNDGLQIENKSSYMDDETEPPEDKEEAAKEKQEDGELENAIDIMMEEKALGDQNTDSDKGIIEHNNLLSIKDKVLGDKSDETKNLVTDNTSGGKKFPLSKKTKKRSALSVKEATAMKATKKKGLASDNKTEEPETREEATSHQAGKTKRNVNDLENSTEVKTGEGVRTDPEDKNDKKDDNGTENTNSASKMDEVRAGKSYNTETVVNQKATINNKRALSKTKKDAALTVKNTKAVKKGKPTSSRAVKGCDLEAQKENIQIPGNKRVTESSIEFLEKIIPKADKVNLNTMTGRVSKDEPMWFILTGHTLQRKEFQQIIRRLKGKVCRVSHQWSYQATHLIVPDPIRRMEKFFAAAASGRWILKTDYLSASNQAGRFVAEEPYEWHKSGLSEDGQINLEAPRKWRLLKEKTGHGAFYGMRIIIYGECIAPTLDTLKRVVKAGDGTILATSPPYTRLLNTGIDFAIVSPGMPHVDIWVQEFIRHEIPCVSADYLVEYVCKPGYPLERHVQYDTHVWAERSFNKLKERLNEEMSQPRTPEDSNGVACEVCGSHDRGEEMLICGDESGSSGCGIGMHIDCCDPPFEDVPEEDWYCPKCSKAKKSSKKKVSASRGK